MLFPKISGSITVKNKWKRDSIGSSSSSRERSLSSHEAVSSEEDEPSHRRVVPFHTGDFYDVIPGRLAFSAHRNDEHTMAEIRRLPKVFFFSSDLQDRFEPFCADFGPVKLSVVHRFCDFVHSRMTDPRLAKRHLVYYCASDGACCANTAFLLGCYAMLHWSYTPEEAYAPFRCISPSPFPGFRDATYRQADYTISLLDCFRGIRLAISQGWYEHGCFDVEEYEFLDDPVNGDLHEVTPKFIAFKGPEQEKRKYVMDLDSKTPEDYIALFKEKGVTAVVRLNEKDTYDARPFTDSGIRHYDLFFEDCGIPPQNIIRKFLDVCDKEPGRIAVHCKAGLGRTGTMIALWMMRTLHCKADDCIAWLRIVRPGSVIGAQQHFLKLCDRVKWDGNTPCLSKQLREAACPRNASADAWEVACAMAARDKTRIHDDSHEINSA